RASCSRITSHAIAATRRAGDHHKLHSSRRLIAHFMRLARSNFDPLAAIQIDFASLNFDRQHAPQHIKELRRTLMEVSHFACPRRHSFFDYAKRAVLNEVPPIALGSPRVMFGGLPVDHRRSLSCLPAA